VLRQPRRITLCFFQDLLAKQMRPYLAVAVGGAVYQDRDRGLRFEGVATLSNNGMTPAHKIRNRGQAMILPHPLPIDFAFPLPGEPDGGPVLNPRESYVLRAVVDDFVPDNEVAAIKNADGRALYVWGTVSFKDELGISHETKYCHYYIWTGQGEKEVPNGFYHRQHNEAT
jgi:hypothetical protein